MAGRNVNARQLDVLQWIVDGCPSRDWPDTTYKSTALALQGRRLVVVSRKAGTWRAVPTDAGRYYSKHGRYPDGHWTPAPRTSALRASSSPQSPKASRTAPGQPSDGRKPSKSVETSTSLSPAAQLLADIQEANGVLPITPDQRERYGKVLGALKRTKGLLPEGKTVLLTVRDGSWCLVLDDPPPPLLPIRVKARLSSKSHPAVATVRDGRTRVLSRPVLARALRCVDALATESERRGYEITGTTSGIVVAVRGHRTSIEFKEPQDRSPHEPTPAEIAEDSKWSWRTYPAYDYKPSGRLRIEVGHSRFEDPKPKADGRLTARAVEDRLAEVLARAEARALEAKAADRYREEQAARRRRHWEEVRAQAIIDYGEHYRAQALLDQAARFADSQRLDEYLAALDDHIAGMFDPDERAAAEEWREWASEYRQRRDPFARAPRMPPVPDPNHDDLAPFMRGLSAWGPA